MEGRVVLVTGASSGIGREVARQLISAQLSSLPNPSRVVLYAIGRVGSG